MAEPASMTCEEFLDVAAAVALDATDVADVRRLEQHAAKCPSCRARLDEFRDTAAALGSFVPLVEPPAVLRSRLMEAIAHEPRPLAPIRRLWPGRARVSPAWLVAAASMLVALASLAWVAMLQTQIADLQRTIAVASDRASRFDHVVQVLASDQLAVRPLEPVVQTLPTSGYVFLDPGSGTGMLMCHRLPPVEQGHAYQIWFVRGNERISGGMLWPDRSGDGYTIIQVPQDLQNWDSIGLTDEPGTGSEWPTTPRVIGTLLRN
jgi:bacterioferritin-associated ferredoxin